MTGVVCHTPHYLPFWLMIAKLSPSLHTRLLNSITCIYIVYKMSVYIYEYICKTYVYTYIYTTHISNMYTTHSHTQVYIPHNTLSPHLSLYSHIPSYSYLFNFLIGKLSFPFNKLFSLFSISIIKTSSCFRFLIFK